MKDLSMIEEAAAIEQILLVQESLDRLRECVLGWDNERAEIELENVSGLIPGLRKAVCNAFGI